LQEAESHQQQDGQRVRDRQRFEVNAAMQFVHAADGRDDKPEEHGGRHHGKQGGRHPQPGRFEPEVLIQGEAGDDEREPPQGGHGIAGIHPPAFGLWRGLHGWSS
jgi:hypothetical protein